MIRIVCYFLSLLMMIGGWFGLPRSVKYKPEQYEMGLPSCILEGDVRVELLSDTLVRIEKKGPKGFENRPSFTVEKRTGWDTVEFTDAVENGVHTIRTDTYTVYLPVGAADAADVYITAPDGERIWEFAGETDANLYLPSPSDALKSWYFCDSPRVIPSENGYAVKSVMKAHNGWDLDNQSQDVFVFLPRGDYRTFLADFVELTGRSEMLPLQMLGFWDSRYYEYTADSALQQIHDYRDRGYPLDMLVIDTDWRSAQSGTGYEINKNDFPNFRRFADQAHELGVGLIFNDHPEPTWGTENLLDLPEVVYRNYNLKKILKQGLDYWWYDRNWWTGLKPIDEKLSIYTSGMYAFHEIEKEYYESVAAKGEYARRPAIMSNVDGIGNGNLEYPSELAAHRYSLQWTGDIGPTSEDLRDEIFNMIYGGAQMGLPYLSSDLGGHTSEVTPDMYIRWIQYGALSPIMRVHCTKPYSRMPWLYGDLAEQVTHTYVDMRYRPLFYSLAHENYETGLPLVRRLDIDYPQYPQAAANDEYLLGDSILVAPLTESCPQTSDYRFTCNGHDGLLAEYFANESFAGEPEVVRYESSPSHDWFFDAPEGLSVSDYFTARWTGELSVGEKPIFFRIMSDDGIRVWLDDELIVDGWDVWDVSFDTGYIEANSTHKIKIEYFDGNNHAHIFFNAYSDGDVSRDVFLPDGDWMDVWSGETYAGPTTVTVSHGLETSPIFVRLGSVQVLADNMASTSSGDWSHLTLDVYPKQGASDEATIYEDDCKTVAYKDGKFRTTKIRLAGNDVQTLTVDAAQGGFDGERAFSEREYTVRIHPGKLGELRSVTLNGAPVEFRTVLRDTDAAPFAVKGGDRNSDIYEVLFTADISEHSELIFEFRLA